MKLNEKERFQQFANEMIGMCNFEIKQAHQKGTPKKAIEYLRRAENKVNNMDFDDEYTMDEMEFVVDNMRAVYRFAEKYIRDEAMHTPFMEEDKNEQ